MDKEEGEMSDDNAMFVDEDDIKEQAQPTESCTVLYKADKDDVTIEQLEKIDAVKLEERAKRFGLNLSGNRIVTQRQIDELYTKSGIKSGNERHFRFDTLHLNGIDALSTREIFEYLEDYKPVSLERIDDVTCNIVCQDHISAALALLVHSREIRNNDVIKMLEEQSSHHWREGMPHPKKDIILMRFATNGDKRSTKKKSEHKIMTEETNDFDESMDPTSKNPWGDLCKSWGVYDHQEVFQRKLPKNDYEDEIEEPQEIVKVKNKQLAKRLGKRSQNEYSEDESSSDSEWKKKSKVPRMRMHADDEESYQQKKKKHVPEPPPELDSNAYTSLSIEVVNSKMSGTPREATKLSDKFKKNREFKKISIQSRLGAKLEKVQEMSSSDDILSDDSDYNVMSRVQKVNANTKSASSVWDRLESKKNNKNESHKDLRQILKSKSQKPKSTVDLRDRICKQKKSSLRIEIDNN